MSQLKRLPKFILTMRFSATPLALALAVEVAAYPQTNPLANSTQNAATYNAQNSPQPAAPTTPQTVSGTVVDATSGQPIFRALVKLNSQNSHRAMLTDSGGHFTFAEVEPSNISLSATKPGYGGAPYFETNGIVLIPSTSMAEPAILRLYPECIIKGTVTDPEGNPMPNVGVQAFHIFSIDGAGRQINQASSTNTNSRGRFRMAVQAGDYRVQTTYTPLHASSALPVALLPTIFPEGESVSGSLMNLTPGQQQEVTLHPSVDPLLKIVVHGQSARELANLTAFTDTGATIPVHFTPVEVLPGVYDLTALLPLGTFTLRSIRRGPEGESIQQATLKINGSQTSPIPVALQFLPVPTIPIELTVEDPPISADSTTQPMSFKPNVGMLGLRLEPVALSPSTTMDLLMPRRAGNSADFSFVTPPGNYRLVASGIGNFYIDSATYGDTDVLGHEMLIAAGGASTPLRITVSTQPASIRGTVMLNGSPGRATVYALANFTSATPIRTAIANNDGSFMLWGLKPGEYRLLALEHKRPIDASVPASYEPYSAHMVKVTVSASDSSSSLSTLRIEAIPDAELLP